MTDTPSRRSWHLALRLALVPVVAAALLALAILLVGQVLPGSNDVKIALTVVLLVGVGAALGKLVKRRPDLRWPMRVATIAAGVLLIGWYANSLRGKDVQEQLVTVPAAAEPAAAAPAPDASAEGAGGGKEGAGGAEEDAGAGEGEERAPAATPEGPRLLAKGAFRALDHPGSGRAELIRDGRETLLQLRGFSTDGGPDLRVYLASDEDASEFEDLGGLKGTSGNQRYDVPRGTDLRRLDTVLIWCRAFSVPFTAAELS